MAMGGAAAAAMAAAIANAIVASGAIVKVKPEDFQKVLAKADEPLVVCASGGVFSTKYQYLTSYKGFAFFTKSKAPLDLGLKIQTVMADKIWIPT